MDSFSWERLRGGFVSVLVDEALRDKTHFAARTYTTSSTGCGGVCPATHTGPMLLVPKVSWSKMSPKDVAERT